MTPLLWVPAFAGMSGKGALTRTEFALVGGPRVLAQDVPELRLERGERFHQRGGIELPGDAGRPLVCGVIGKMSPVRLPIQHRAAPSLLRGKHRLAGVKFGLKMVYDDPGQNRKGNWSKWMKGMDFPVNGY